MHLLLIDWLIALGYGANHGPVAPRPYLMGPLCPMSNHGSSVALLKFQMVPKLILLISSSSRKKELRCTCLSEAKASQSQRMWDKVFSFTLHSGLTSSPSRWRCLLRVLCPVRRPVAALDWVLLKDKNLAFSPRLGPKINSQACLWVLTRSHHLAQCWLINQQLILFCTSRLETPRVGSGPVYPRKEPPLVSWSAILLPHTPACPGTQ